MLIDLDFFGLTEEVARPITHSLSTKRKGGDSWGWPRLVRVRVSSTNTCPSQKRWHIPPLPQTHPPRVIMRWQKACRGALWVIAVGGAREGWDCKRREAQTRDCLSFQLCLWLSGGWLRRSGGGSQSPTEQPASLPDLGRDMKLASMQAQRAKEEG